MERRESDMRSIKAAAKEELGRVEGVEGVGLGENSLRVYVKNAEVRKRLPSEFRGLPVDFVITGDISALGAASS
jgi:hypothetical protein